MPQSNKLERNLEISGIIIVILLMVFVKEVQSGVFLGILSTICMGMTYAAMPMFMKRAMCRFKLAIDLVLAFAVPLWFGSFTATAVIGSATNSILVSILLNEEARRIERMDANLI